MSKTTFGILALALLVSSVSFGAATTGLPWETPLQTIGTSLTGPVAGFISLIAIVLCGITAAIGQDLSGFVKGLIGVVFVISVILGGASIIRILFGSAGAVISTEMISSHRGARL
jgi:type IV secretory pathway VirB2 component (pilin)